MVPFLTPLFFGWTISLSPLFLVCPRQGNIFCHPISLNPPPSPCHQWPVSVWICLLMLNLMSCPLKRSPGPDFLLPERRIYSTPQLRQQRMQILLLFDSLCRSVAIITPKTSVNPEWWPLKIDFDLFFGSPYSWEASLFFRNSVSAICTMYV